MKQGGALPELAVGTPGADGPGGAVEGVLTMSGLAALLA